MSLSHRQNPPKRRPKQGLRRTGTDTCLGVSRPGGQAMAVGVVHDLPLGEVPNASGAWTNLVGPLEGGV